MIWLIGAMVGVFVLGACAGVAFIDWYDGKEDEA